MSCAKAGPHWRVDLPLTTSPAVELLPYSESGGLVLPGPSQRHLQPFSLHDVALIEGTHVSRAAATNLRYLLSLPIDSLLYAWRRNAKLPQPAGAKPLRGWESPGSELRGHILGHWLSATAFSCATADAPTRQELASRIGTVVDTLRRCQQASGWLAAFPEEFLDRVEAIQPVWAPYYTLHKLLQGLLDQAELPATHACHAPRALPIARGLARYIGRRVAGVVERKGLSHHWLSLNKEFGGLNDVLWRLYMNAGGGGEAGAEGDGGNEEVGRAAGLRLRSTASLFDRPCLLGPLAAQQDTLSHMHANTQLPVLQGAHSRFEATGDARFRRLALFFVELLLRTRTFATGGSSIGEYWVDAHHLGELVAPGEGTTQESCSTHNMMRLARGLLLTAQPREAEEHAAFHERALFNSVLGTQRGEKPGEMLYWLPLGAGVSKMDLRHPTHGDGQQHGWSHPHGDFWCCVGSGLESFARLGDSTFFRQVATGASGTSNPTLWLMQLVSSRLAWREAGYAVTLTVDEPGSLAAGTPLQLKLQLQPLEVSATSGGLVTLRLRLPRWAWRGDTPPAVTLNGAPLPSPPDGGAFAEVTRAWRAGEALRTSLPMPLRLERLADPRPRYRHLHAVLCGPVLLAGLTRGERQLLADPARPEAWLRAVPASAAAQLRSLLLGGGAVSALPGGGLSVADGGAALPEPTAHDATDVTWRLLCVPEPCTPSSALAFEHFAQPNGFLGAPTAAAPADAAAAPLGVISLPVARAASEGAVPATALFRLLQAAGGDGEAAAGVPVGVPASSVAGEAPMMLEAVGVDGMLLCAERGRPVLRRLRDAAQQGRLSAAERTSCEVRLGAGVARYAPLSVWATPERGRGFLFVPLKDVVDEVYSVYFHVAHNETLPTECSMTREAWRGEAEAERVPAATRELAARVLSVGAANWAGVKGMRFEAEGQLQTPWNKGKWGALHDKPATLFADFGGAQHELTFAEWPNFVSTRCSDGEVVHGSMLPGSAHA